MKILDKYLLKSFLITFASVFVILFFIFVLQVVWLFISELAGKDLDFLMIIKFLLFKMPSIIPLVLPLSVVLASIMTFGSLAENYEFAAMKSAGISLQRAMRSLIVFIFGLSIVAFIFANNVIPYAEYKFQNFRRNIAQVKPAMAIAEGQFSQIGTYNIKVEKKSGENGKFLKGVTIHQLSTETAGSTTVIKAKRGELISSEDSNILKLVLKDGNYYEDIIPKKFEDRNKVPFAKSVFKRYVINIDLSKLNKTDLNKEDISNTNTMLTLSELRYTIDSLQKNYNKDVISVAENVNQRSVISNTGTIINNSAPSINQNNVLQGFSVGDKTQILRVASSNIDAANFSIESAKFDLDDKEKNIDQHWIALYDKFVIAYACLLMFFIGAPLGAIIRKGGLGLPIVFAIVIFIIFHFINTFGKKVAQEDQIAPFLGCWMSSFVLTPLAILLTKNATADKGFTISFDWFTNLFNRQKNEPESDNAAADGFDVKAANKALAKITKKESKKSVVKPLVKIDAIEIGELSKQYKKYSLFAIIGYLALCILVLSFELEKLPVVISVLVITAAFYFMIYKAQSALSSIGNQTGGTTDLKSVIVYLGAFPFYPLFYCYNYIYLKNLSSSINTKS